MWDKAVFPLYLFPTLADKNQGEQSAMKKPIQIRPDAKGRITLGRLAKNVSSFRVSEQPGGALLLEPMVEIPAREKWLYENNLAHESVKRGLMQSRKAKDNE